MAFLLFNHKIKYLFYTIVVAGLILLIAFQEDVLYTYIASIFSSSASADVKGSSVEMRLTQLLGCFDIISSNPLFGNGFGWTAYYNQMNGDHPVVLAFESYIFVTLCNWGLVGFVVWLLFLWKIYRKCIILAKKKWMNIICYCPCLSLMLDIFVLQEIMLIQCTGLFSIL